MGERSSGARVKASKPTAGLPKRKGVIMHKGYMSISMRGVKKILDNQIGVSFDEGELITKGG